MAGIKQLTITLLADFHLSLRNISRQRRRSFIALAAIGFGVIAMMLAAGFIEWIFWANREAVAVNQLGHIQLVKPGYFEGGKADPFAFLIPDKSTALSIISRANGVSTVTPRLSFSGLISHNESTISFIGEGIDPSKDPSRGNFLVLEGRLLSTDDPKGVLLGAGLAANLGVKTGDTIVLLANTASGGINAVEGKVRGIVTTSIKAIDNSMLRLTITMARELLRVSGSHIWVISLQSTDMTASVASRLMNEQGLREYEIAPWNKLADFYEKTVQLLSRQIGVVKLIIAIIIILSISNTMTMSVLERTIEIGTSMALGVRRRRILRLFLLEGGLLGVIGGISGTLLGYILASIISEVGIPMPPAPGMSRGFTAAVIVTPSIILEAFLLAVSTTLIASIYPAWRASRMVIIDALRHNR